MLVRPRTKDGIDIVIGMRLWHRNGGPSGVVTAITDGGLCATVKNGDDEANWHVCRSYSSLEATHEKCV